MTTDTSTHATAPNSNRLLEVLLNNTLRSPLRLFGWAFVLFLIVAVLANIARPDSTYSLRQFVQQFIFGLSTGSIYALIALGYTLVYGILLMINFAHGEVFMAGAYAGFFLLYSFQESGFLGDQTILALIVGIAGAAVFSIMVAVLLERLAYRPLRRAPRLVPLITAIGASITLQQLFLRLFGASARRYPDITLPLLPGTLGCDEAGVCPGIDIFQSYNVSGVNFRPIFFVVFFLALVLMALLWFFIKRTKTGKAMRAVAEDKNTAALMGINVDSVIVTTFVLGAALAGAGAVLFAIIPGNGQITPTMGLVPGIKAFTAAVLGGIGNVPGAMFGGMFLGVAESVGPSLIGLPSQLKDVVAFTLLVLILIFRPSGIFGEVLSEKKA